MKKWSVLAALGGALVAAAAPARADQCAWLPPAVAQRALAAVQQHGRLVTFCEPCGDPAPGEPATVRSVRVASDAQAGAAGMQELWVDGAPIDLAYAYVQTSPARYDNLAALAGCTTTGVSPGLDVVPEPDGVLITASAKPVAPAEAAVAAAPPPPAPAVITVPVPEVIQAPAQVVMVPAPDAGWGSPLLVALGGAACASAGWLAWLLAAVRRRQRGSFAPRALGLGRPDV